jgi:ubiquinone/menaquinone biosynthesis C-methylase UbiE
MTGGFDRVAGIYRPLEYLAFGRMLERAREAFLSSLASSEAILLLGDGDGRCLEAVLRLAPRALVTSVDSSAAMLARARRRARALGAESRVTFEHADARRWRPAAGGFDAIATMFFLDCFTVEDVDRIVSALVPGLRPGGQWLFADFAIPPRGLPRLHARLLVGALYAFFRWRTRIEARALPPSEAILARHGLRAIEWRAYRAGLVRSVRLAR